ncbi:MAG: Gfo/Idh/MocA family protein, partial [Planctomycetaceae bacterium]
MKTSDKIRFGILGTARIAEKVGKAITDASNASLSVIASRDLDRAEEWAKQHSADRFVGSYEEVLDDPNIDAVYIPLPPSLHAEWTERAAAAGKHVLCEKPLAATVTDARRMAEACKKYDVQFMDGVMWMHHPRERDMRGIIDSGQLGELKHMASAFTFRWPTVPENDFRTKREFGGGSLLDLGWYCVGAAMWAFGEMPHRVFGSANFRNEVDMHFNGMLWFSDGKTATIDCGFDTVMRRWFELAGTEKSLVCDDFTRPWKEEKPRFWIHQTDGSADERISDSPVQETCMVEAFSAAILSGTRNEAWPRHALQVQQVCEALDQSARSGQPVDL